MPAFYLFLKTDLSVLSINEILSSLALLVLALSIKSPIAENGHSIKWVRLKDE
jgi:hypothetical protein